MIIFFIIISFSNGRMGKMDTLLNRQVNEVCSFMYEYV